MSLHDHLLEQANHLARRDRTRPKQASLRRSISTAYYALFHLLTSEAAAVYAFDPALAARINRMVNHADLRKTSLMFTRGHLLKGLRPPGGGYQTPTDLKIVANAVVVLQEARHEADYDLSRTFLRQEAQDLVEEARGAFAAWGKIRKTDDARLYLDCFLLYKRFDEEPRGSAAATS